MLTLADNLKSHFKITTLNIFGISEEYQKKYIQEFQKKKIDELKQIIDSELWTHAQVNSYFQGIVDKINSIELFEQSLNQELSAQGQMTMKDVLIGPENEYKVLISLMKFMSIVFEFLRLIASFPQVSFDGTTKLIELIKVSK